MILQCTDRVQPIVEEYNMSGCKVGINQTTCFDHTFPNSSADLQMSVVMNPIGMRMIKVSARGTTVPQDV
jgi:hypothetical protein